MPRWGDARGDLAWPRRAEASGPASPLLTPGAACVKAAYLSYFGVGDRLIRERVFDLADTTELNAIVIDVKGDRGFIPYETRVPLALEAGAVGPVRARDVEGCSPASGTRELCPRWRQVGWPSKTSPSPPPRSLDLIVIGTHGPGGPAGFIGSGGHRWWPGWVRSRRAFPSEGHRHDRSRSRAILLALAREGLPCSHLRRAAAVSSMKKIEAVIRPFELDEIKEALVALGVGGMTVTGVRGVGHQPTRSFRYGGAECTIDLLPRTKVEIVVADNLVEPVVATISKVAWTGSPGDGKVFVLPLMTATICTGEVGETAL